MKLTQATITNPALRESLRNRLSKEGGGALLAYYLSSFWKFILIGGAIFFLIFLLWGGMMWISAGSNTESIKQAKDRIMNAAMGLGLLIASYAIMEYLLPMLGINIFYIDWETLTTGRP